LTFDEFIKIGNMKKLQIKVWPETVHYLPSVQRFAGTVNTMNDIRIDFSDCRQITSTGLTVLLLRLLTLLHGGTGQRRWETDNTENNPIFETVKKLGFFDHLNKYYPNASILAPETNDTGPFQPTEHTFLYGRNVTSFPILRLDFTKNKSGRRSEVKSFTKELHKLLLDLEPSNRIQANHLASIFNEMAKNSADHTEGDAFFGMDIINIPEKNSIELHFVLGDLGNGIKQHIQDHLPHNFKEKRGKHWSLYESYYFALKHGYTSTPESPKNKGLGMSIILDGAKGINMSLSVFDADSRGILSSLKDPTHEELRKHFIAFTKDRAFYYYGSVESEAL
jgi:hypothetical protein